MRVDVNIRPARSLQEISLLLIDQVECALKFKQRRMGETRLPSARRAIVDHLVIGDSARWPQSECRERVVPFVGTITRSARVACEFRVHLASSLRNGKLVARLIRRIQRLYLQFIVNLL